MLRLDPPRQPLPDNIWHTLLISLLVTVYLWLGWVRGLEAFRSGEPAALSERWLAEGTGAHPLFHALEGLTDPLTPWVWNRVLSCVSWALTLGLTVRLLTRVSGFLSSLPTVMLMAALPGFSLRMCAGASGSPSVWLFLMAFSALLLEEDQGAWLRGGVYAGLATALSPDWFLPSLGLFVGLWEVNRPRLPRAAAGFGAALLVTLLLFVVFQPSGLSFYFSARSGEGGLLQALPELLRLYPFLLGLAVLMLAYGCRRRGMLWWSLVGAIPAALFAFSWVPLVVLFLLGLARLPSLLGLPHPRVYQTVLVCQLLLALSSFL